MKIVTMKIRNSSGVWREYSLPPWIKLYQLVDARARFQVEQAIERGKLGYCSRTSATSWVSRNLVDWAQKIGHGFDSLLLAYALCLNARAIKLSERDYT
jgi:hypothetical protein